MKENKCLEEWKKGMIFPINKTTRSFWNQDLNLTRPITLIETVWKIFLKVIVNRLTKILSKEKILQGSNFAALKNESTLEPIKIVQSIIEDANKEKKEAWILLMDISKAYDSVSSIMLKKSLERIKLPNEFINLVMDINLKRHNKVIVNKEFTEEYYVEVGIDQGEVWSPILWRIFYDALLTRLEKMKYEVGYMMNVEKHVDISRRKDKEIKVYHNNVAFMDDTTLITKNIENAMNSL